MKLRCENVFIKLFAKFFAVLASFSKFLVMFRPIQIRSDLLGCVRMHLEAFGQFRQNLEFCIFKSFSNHFHFHRENENEIENENGRNGPFSPFVDV